MVHIVFHQGFFSMTLLNVVKALHVLSAILWLGTLFILQLLPHKRLLHTGFHHVIKKIYRYVDLPSLLVLLATGGIMLYYNNIDFKAAWFHTKMTGAFLLIVSDIWTFARIRKEKPFSMYPLILYVVSILCVLSAIYLMRDKKKEWFKEYFVDGFEMIATKIV